MKEKFDYPKLLRRSEWQEKRLEIIGKSPVCAKCGRRGRRFAVHHVRYEYGKLPWEYPEDAYMVVCNASCHQEADEDREEKERDAENYRQYGWQYDLGKSMLRPRDNELRRLAENESEFLGWLTAKEILTQDWNWKIYPLWYLWTKLSPDFLLEKPTDDKQGLLNL